VFSDFLLRKIPEQSAAQDPEAIGVVNLQQNRENAWQPCNEA
jgi:hypothetical protein